jgi:hypothetical protein
LSRTLGKINVKKFAWKERFFYRATNGSNWQKIDISSFGSAAIKITSDENGDIILFTNKGDQSRYDGTNWTSLTTATANSDSLYANLMSVDKNGTIWGAFVRQSDYHFKGMCFSSDSGTTWTYAGLDSIKINFLSTIGDTTFAVTESEGIYGFSLDNPTFVEGQISKKIGTYRLFQNYPNPFNPVTNIIFNIPKQAVVTIKIWERSKHNTK